MPSPRYMFCQLLYAISTTSVIRSVQVKMTSVKFCPLLLLSFSLLSMGKDCPYPVLSDQIILSPESIQKNHFPDNSKAYVVCPKGHEKENGSDSITCIDGTWSAVELNCKKIDCGSPKPSAHMNYSIPDGTLFGAFIKVTCEKGYDLEGVSFKQCLVSGWSGNSQCVLITCDEPESIAHGTFSKPKETPELDDVIEYSCDDNYALFGNRYLTCTEDWTYSSQPPTCKEIECSVPEISFGNQTEGNPPYFYKSNATFECWPGYRMKGLATSVCEKSGWSALPVCVKVLITQRITSTTTNKATTTATFTATTNSNGRYGGQLINHSLSVGIVILVFFAVFCAAFCICALFVYHKSKHRGSYNTGEEWRTKEELLLYQSL
ncbi:membrane cofactor protein isoform X2 [Pseudorasbora parva]|uniref:membrane cofactor protein isoform X2 n=1 Tax=Pseudorasbora parva TaxID=51549 RepID=UPI00351E6732